jgi:hypothetical protein
VKRFPGEEFKPEWLNLTVKHPLKVMVWGCMADCGVGRLHIVDGIVNVTKYIGILPSAQQLFQNQFLFRKTMHHAIVPNWFRLLDFLVGFVQYFALLEGFCFGCFRPCDS